MNSWGDVGHSETASGETDGRVLKKDHQNHPQGPAAQRLQWPREQRLTILTTTSRPTFRTDHPSSHTSSTRLFQRLGCLAEPGPGKPGN